MPELVDREQRRQALDPLRSFCVSAPAGSGKTALLVQRYLAVLARVAAPEQVLAITFTRKAAAQMRERVVDALERAGEEPVPADEHHARTRELAREVLERARQQQWRLLEVPTRLNIRTIDSWTAQLTRQLPILSNFGGSTSPVDRPEPYYRQAVRALLEGLWEGHRGGGDLAQVMLHFDNDWQRLEELLMRMLGRREQLLMYLGGRPREKEVEQGLRESIENLIGTRLRELSRHFDGCAAELLSCLNYSLENRNLATLDHFPGSEPGDLEDWLLLIELLLNKQGDWRKRWDIRLGFPPGEQQGKEEAQARKGELGCLSQALQDIPGLQQQLHLARALPRFERDAESSQVLMALARLLPVAAAQLTLVFQQQGVVDHSQVAMAAREALGDDDHVTDLAQRLDYSLRHILVDEFQDTSASQFELLRRLTRGWASDNEQNPQHPRTLFLVGDSMQSIYGFRDADVSLFMRVRARGFGGLEMANLQLTTNFRSDAGLVDWVGRVFHRAFPQRDDGQLGAVAFSPSRPFLPAGQEQPVRMAVALCAGGADQVDQARADEARCLVDEIEQGLADADCRSIAVLVRSRLHLLPLVEELKRRGIPWQAQEIDPLRESPVIVDLVSLCRALHNLVDDVAWLALLRAPWVGLSVANMLALCGERGQASVWQQLNDEAALRRLDAVGGRAVRQFLRVIHASLALRERLPLRVWIEHTWLGLGGPAAAGSDQQRQDAVAFLDLLEQREAMGESFSSESIEQQVESLFSTADDADGAGCKLQLMTLHKAKGLEFDWVMIPALARKTAAEPRDLLLWNNFIGSQGQPGFLFAADERGQEEDGRGLYQWLRQIQKLRRDEEATRLLYVGCTRAVKRLFLSSELLIDEDAGAWQEREPARSSLLSRLWADFAAEARPIGRNQVLTTPPVASRRPPLRRLQQLPDLPVAATTVAPPAPDPQPDIAVLASDRHSGAREVGTLVHLSLERLSTLNPEQQAEFAAPQWSDWWRRFLQARLPAGVAVEPALARVEQALGNVLQDERGRWLLSSLRQQARSEYRLSGIDAQMRVRDFVVDRSFLADGVRWVVDYKSAEPGPGESRNDFCARQALQYRGQMLAYRDCFLGMGDRQVKLALYFTSLPLWYECDYG